MAFAKNFPRLCSIAKVRFDVSEQGKEGVILLARC